MRDKQRQSEMKYKNKHRLAFLMYSQFNEFLKKENDDFRLIRLMYDQFNYLFTYESDEGRRRILSKNRKAREKNLLPHLMYLQFNQMFNRESEGYLDKQRKACRDSYKKHRNKRLDYSKQYRNKNKKRISEKYYIDNYGDYAALYIKLKKGIENAKKENN